MRDEDKEDDEDMEITAEEEAEREAMLNGGASAAIQDAQRVREIPLDVAMEIEKASRIFREAFAQGASAKVMGEFADTNRKIKELNRK